jgi:hypothetical protein
MSSKSDSKSDLSAVHCMRTCINASITGEGGWHYRSVFWNPELPEYGLRSWGDRGPGCGENWCGVAAFGLVGEPEAARIANRMAHWNYHLCISGHIIANMWR